MTIQSSALEVDYGACALCAAPLSQPPVRLNQQPVCGVSAAQVERELDAERAAPRFGRAALLGAVGALIGAAVWAGIVVATNFEVGYVAVLVGFLAGQGVKLGAGAARGGSLQILAAALAVGGLAAAKHMTVAWTLEISPLDPLAFQALGEVIGKLLSPFDLLWIFLAVGAAYRVPAQVAVAVER